MFNPFGLFGYVTGFGGIDDSGSEGFGFDSVGFDEDGFDDAGFDDSGFEDVSSEDSGFDSSLISSEDVCSKVGSLVLVILLSDDSAEESVGV